MRIIMRTGLAGHGFAYRSGQEVDLDEAAARRLISRGLAVPARETSVEVTTAPEPERTAARSAGSRRRRGTRG